MICYEVYRQARLVRYSRSVLLAAHARFCSSRAVVAFTYTHNLRDRLLLRISYVRQQQRFHSCSKLGNCNVAACSEKLKRSYGPCLIQYSQYRFKLIAAEWDIELGQHSKIVLVYIVA